jgi:hypothetical protein
MHCADLSPYSNNDIKPINKFEDVDYIDDVRFSKKKICASDVVFALAKKRSGWWVCRQTAITFLHQCM